MDQELKDFMEKVKDEFKKMKKSFDDLSGEVYILKEDLQASRMEKEKKKDEDWF